MRRGKKLCQNWIHGDRKREAKKQWDDIWWDEQDKGWKDGKTDGLRKKETRKENRRQNEVRRDETARKDAEIASRQNERCYEKMRWNEVRWERQGIKRCKNQMVWEKTEIITEKMRQNEVRWDETRMKQGKIIFIKKEVYWAKKRRHEKRLDEKRQCKRRWDNSREVKTKHAKMQNN